MVYTISGLISMIGAYIYSKCSNRNRVRVRIKNINIIGFSLPKVMSSFLMFFPLFIPAALRYGIGTDYFATYVPLFMKIASGKTGFNEAGFTWFVFKLSNITSNYQWFFVITSFLTISLIIETIKAQSANYVTSILLFILGTYYFYSYSGIRQALATAIFIYGLRFVEEKKPIKYGICILLATTVHLIAIIYAPIYFFSMIKRHTKIRIGVIGILYLLKVSLGPIIRSLILSTPYAWYIGSKFDTGESGILLLLMNIGTLALGLLFCDDEDAKGNLYINIHTVGLVVSLYASMIPVALRINYLFFFINFISVPYFLSRIKKNIKRLITTVTLLAYLVFCVYTAFVINAFGTSTYVSIFS